MPSKKTILHEINFIVLSCFFLLVKDPCYEGLDKLI